MKIRNGFVSNSSSSSFVIKKDQLTAQQIGIILKPKKHILKNFDKIYTESDLKYNKGKCNLWMLKHGGMFETRLTIPVYRFGQIEDAQCWNVQVDQTDIFGRGRCNFSYEALFQYLKIQNYQYYIGACMGSISHCKGNVKDQLRSIDVDSLDYIFTAIYPDGTHKSNIFPTNTEEVQNENT